MHRHRKWGETFREDTLRSIWFSPPTGCMKDAAFIAIVDDEEHVRVALRRLCAACDFNPRTFSSAQQLFDSLDREHPDCLILDVQMPGFGGLDALAWMLERGINIPAIVITGRDDEEVRVRAAALGVCAYLCKPFDVEVLLGAIGDALSAGRRAAQQESVAARVSPARGVSAPLESEWSASTR